MFTRYQMPIIITRHAFSAQSRITEQIFAMQFLEENVLSFPNTIFYLLTKKQQSTKSLIFIFI